MQQVSITKSAFAYGLVRGKNRKTFVTRAANAVSLYIAAFRKCTIFRPKCPYADLRTGLSGGETGLFNARNRDNMATVLLPEMARVT
ncbi:hypothetical protein [Novosphingobium sediminicola]|uniref:Uncharacterized protein n=1 Tax=Novosphingobium sediminicola TaxID=563162 RepID=A0A7W6G7P1_9SPHN|nr:hypothetical protein [Novosphingobium sediminicola]MBB3956578.1 hypothetical protein [Novosphingobium sediminicola]